MAEDRAAALRAEASRVLAPLADLAPPAAPGAEPPYDVLVRISVHHAHRAAECMASVAFEPAFDGWRAAFARRRIGRVVLERLRKGAGLDPSSVARAVVDDAATHGRDGLSQWLATLGPGGLAAVVREATTWAVAARASMRTWPPRPGTTFDEPPVRYRWRIPGRAVQLEAEPDGVTGPTASLLVFATGTPDGDRARREVAWLGLVAALDRGAVARDVTRIDLASGDRVTRPLTDDVLDSGLTAAAAAVEAVMAARFTAPAPPTAGRWCPRCLGRPGCDEGSAWVISHAT